METTSLCDSESDLTSADRCPENIEIHAIIVAELKLRDVQRQIFAAYLVKAAHDAAFNQRPKALNRVGVDRTNDVLACLMVYSTVRIFTAKIDYRLDRRQCTTN